MRIILAINLAVTFCINTYAQDTINRGDISISSNIKINYFNFDNLNQRLTSVGYPELNNSLTSMGIDIIIGDIYGSFYNSVYGGFISGYNKNDNYSTGLLIGEFNSNIHFNVLNKNKMILHPYLGFGFLTGNITIKDLSNDDQSFNNAISNLSGMTEITTGDKLKGMINLGIGFDYAISREGDVLLGIYTGYRLMFKDMDWFKDGNSLDDSPNFKLSGFYIGFGLTFS